MKEHEEPILEAEVVEIDGVAVEPRPEVEAAEKRYRGRVDWQGWQGRIRVLDKRWMPLWIVLGLIAFLFLATVGLLVAIIVVVFWIFKTILRAVFSVFTGSDQSVSRRS